MAALYWKRRYSPSGMWCYRKRCGNAPSKLTILKHLNSFQSKTCSPYRNGLLCGRSHYISQRTVRCSCMLEMQDLENETDILFARLFLIILSSLVYRITALKTVHLLVSTCVFIWQWSILDVFPVMRSSESSETDSDEESVESDKDDDEQMPAQGVQTVPLQCTLSHFICYLWQRRNVALL